MSPEGVNVAVSMNKMVYNTRRENKEVIIIVKNSSLKSLLLSYFIDLV